MVGIFVFTNSAQATQEVCPDTDGNWVKVDDLDGHSYTYPTPEGYQVTDNCYKHSTFVHFGTGDTVETDEHSVCHPIFFWICSDKRFELSHASFLLEEIPNEEEEEDYCDTLEGVQAEDEDCPIEEEEECPEGTHAVYFGNNQEYEVPVCEPDVPPSVHPSDERFAPSSTEAPQCPNGDTVSLVANAHVLRAGESATVNFFITEGDRAHVFWRVSGTTEWTNSSAQEYPQGLMPNSDKFVSYTLGGLNPTGDYDFGIMQTNGCGGGVVSVVVDSYLPMLFMYSHWENYNQ